MLTGAERSETLWALSDRLDAFSKKLYLLHLSIRYYTMTDVWNSVTAGMIDRSNGEWPMLPWTDGGGRQKSFNEEKIMMNEAWEG